MVDAEAAHLKTETVGDFGEERLIETLIAPIACNIGDDAAQIRPPSGASLLVSTDALVESIHFLRESPADWLGHKALGINISDMAASGGEPKWATLALNLPHQLPISWVKALLAGFGEALEKAGVALVGGDVTASPRDIGITVTILGLREDGSPENHRPTLDRAGADSGDYLAVTGHLGETLPGLLAILGKLALPQNADETWRRRHFFLPNRVEFAKALHERSLASAMMDLSDGLAVDLPRLAKASNVGAEIELDAVPISKGFSELKLDAEDAVLAGEDYELLLSVTPKQWPRLAELAASMAVPLHRIGRTTNHLGVTFLKKGKNVALRAKPWRHFHGDDVV